METEETPHHSGGIYNYFQGATIHNIVINGNMTKSGPENYYAGREEKPHEDRVATREMMSQAAKATLDGGYWKSQRSWSVTFVVYCIWGYKGKVSDFVTEATEWPDGVAERVTCNRDAVEKLKNTYYFSKNIKEWRSNGVPEQYCILGEQLDAELERLLLENRYTE